MSKYPVAAAATTVAAALTQLTVFPGSLAGSGLVARVPKSDSARQSGTELSYMRPGWPSLVRPYGLPAPGSYVGLRSACDGR